jgi:hypothetical protein
MVVSLLERFQKLSARQHLQRRIDLLVGNSTYPSGRMELEPNKKAWIDPFPDSEDVRDTDPIGSSDVAAAIAEAFRRGRPSCSRPH